MSRANGTEPPWVKVPLAIIADKRIGTPAFRLWAVLRMFAWRGELPEMPALMALLDSGERSILRWLRELEDYGYLDWDRKAPLARRYSLKAAPAAAPARDLFARLRQALESEDPDLAAIRALVMAEDLSPESEDLSPESEDLSPGSDPTIRSYDQILVTHDLTPVSDHVSPESEDLSPESEDLSPVSDSSKKFRVRMPGKGAARLLDLKTPQETKTTTTSGKGSSRDDPRLAILTAARIHPTKARKILAARPELGADELRRFLDELQAGGAGAGAIADLLESGAAPGAPAGAGGNWIAGASEADKERYREMGLRWPGDPRGDE